MDGVRAILEGIHLEYSEIEPFSNDVSEGFTERWMDRPSGYLDQSNPVTELVFCSEVPDNDYWHKKGEALGYIHQTIHSLIHTILEDEIVLRVPDPAVMVEDRPLLGHILTVAGFEPTILWQSIDGEWHCERKLGLHWIMPDTWLKRLMQDAPLGRPSVPCMQKVIWVVRETGIDFYRSPEDLRFIGRLPLWPEPMEEQTACQSIAQSLELGVSWLDIRLALKSLWDDVKMTNNLGWNVDDLGWNAGTNREELPALQIDNMENWWAR